MPDNDPHGSNPTPPSDDQRVPIDQAVRFAMALHKQGKLDQAEGLYGDILAAVPDHPDGLHFLGILHYQRGRVDAAIQSIRRALAVSPGYVDAHNNLGNIYMEQKRHEAAESCYRRTVALAPQHVGAYNNLATVLRAMGRLAEAEAVFREGLSISADFYPLHYNLANLLAQQGRVAESVQHYFHAMVLDPDQAGSKVMLGIALMTVGRRAEAITHFEKWLEAEPENPEARHLLAACSGQAVPGRAPDDYVKRMFDRFADSFEESLRQLDYRAPQGVADALAQRCGQRMGSLTILDAGCGTGLCGPLLRPFAEMLEGVDLSPQMLKRAKATGSYDRLAEAELTAFLYRQPAYYDIIAAADTLCYFGDLQAVFAAAAGALKPGGGFIFTVEAAGDATADEGQDYRIIPQGRYAHTETYLRRLARQADLQIETLQHAVLRQEMGRPVKGWIATLGKPPWRYRPTWGPLPPSIRPATDGQEKNRA